MRVDHLSHPPSARDWQRWPVIPATRPPGFAILGRRVAAAGIIEVVLLFYKPNYTWPGLIIVLLGIPVYFLWRRKRSHPEKASG